MGRKKQYKGRKKKCNNATTPEWNYEGLLLSMRHTRNRLLFFILFGVYSFLSVLGTTDKMLYMETPIKIPMLNIELPLLAFYTVMPLFLLVLFFNLLYTFSSHRDYLLAIKKNQPEVLDSLPWGLYEGALLNRDKLHIIIRFIMQLVLYVFPIIILATFWFRFADFQHDLISTWHLIVGLITIIISFSFRGLLNTKKKVRLKKRFAFVGLTLSYSVLTIILISYHIFIIHPLAKEKMSLADIKNYNKRIESLLGKGSTYKTWFVPKIIIYGEVLVTIDEQQLKVLQEVKPNKKDNEALLFSIPQQDKQNRHLRNISLRNCILPNTNFQNSQLQGAQLDDAQLQGANLYDAELQGASLQGAMLQGAHLIRAKLHGAYLEWVELQGAHLHQAELNGANLDNAQLQGAYFNNARLQGSSLDSVDLQGAELLGANLVGANLVGAKLQGASLSSAKLQGAYLRLAQLQGADLSNAQLQGANLVNTQLQGANLSNVQFQGAFLFGAQLQGASSKNGNKFINRKNTGADISNIDISILTKQKANEVIDLIKTYLRQPNLETKEEYIQRFHSTKERLEKAIGIKPVDWIKDQKNINLGILSEDESKRITDRITEPNARKRMDLPRQRKTKFKKKPRNRPKVQVYF